MRRQSLFMETTKVSDTTTVAEIQHLLATHGASAVMVQYQQGRVTALAFNLHVHEQDVPFRLPCRWQAVEQSLRREGKRPRRNDTMEHWARRVAWRQILRWVEAQLALIDTGMAKAEEVFLPYALIGHGGQGKTMYEAIEEQKFLTLPAPTARGGDLEG